MQFFLSNILGAQLGLASVTKLVFVCKSMFLMNLLTVMYC